MNESIEYLNPDGLIKNPAFSHVVVVHGNHKTIYIGGQDSVTPDKEIIGKGDIKAQTEQVLKNLLLALEGAGAKLENVIKWNIYVVQGQPLQLAFEAFREVWGQRPNPPAITLVYIAGLAHPDYLVEMDAVAVVPE